MLKRSIVGPKTNMTISIGSWRGDQDTARVVSEVRAAAAEIRSLSTDRFVPMVQKFLLARYPDKAQRVVDALSDTEPTRLGLALVRILVLIIVAIPVAALASLILWLAQ